MIFPDGSKRCSKPILNKKNLFMHLVTDRLNSDSRVAIISWEGYNSVTLCKDHLSPLGLGKALERYGVVINVSRERHKLTKQMLFAYLVEHALIYELPFTTGWNKTPDGLWEFTSDIALTFKGAENGRFTSWMKNV
jgi:hypothetical protein